MKFRDLTELAWRNLREALLRNSLTTLGIGVGVASLVAMLSLGVGLQEIGQSAALALGPVRRHHRRAPRQFPGLCVAPRRTIRSAAPAGPLDEDARKALERLPNVVEVYPEIRFPTEIRYAGTPYSTVVAGVPESARRSGAYDGMTGAFFSGPAADEAILQIEFARQLSPQPETLARQGPCPSLRRAPGSAGGARSHQFKYESEWHRRSWPFRRIFRGAARREAAHRGNRRNRARQRVWRRGPRPRADSLASRRKAPRRADQRFQDHARRAPRKERLSEL